MKELGWEPLQGELLMDRHSSTEVTRTRTHVQDGSTLVLVPGGDFSMGSLDYSNERPPHQVQLSPFWISQTVITNRMYGRFRAETGHRQADFSNEELYNGDHQPIVGVDYTDAVAYCQWAGGRLPTEAEWEFAARGTDGRTYPWGNEQPDRTRAVYGLVYGKGGKAASVGSHPGDVSPFGLLDMAGNVLEWCSDWGADYKVGSGKPQANPGGAAQGTNRIMRGGCWVYQAESLRTTTRFFSVPHQKVSFAGFRMVVDALESEIAEFGKRQRVDSE
ncbi:MAG: formylglycine-generating enzyme family protein [Pirellulaceae bacterium]|nr:formylglycine-generating enzyme family protein [Pirellulaceae bacterium]